MEVKIMSKFLTSSFVILTSYFVAFAAANDTMISFSTPGPDKYADGATVKDGECYALVWTKTGATFAGLAADGTAVGSDSKVVVFAPVAKGGRCPLVVFELDAELADSYQGGSFGIYLCDTRLANGAVGGLTAAGVPLAVNGFGAAESGEATFSSLQNLEVASSTKSGQETASPLVRVTTKSAVPEGTPKPQITAIRIVGDYVHLTVKGTTPCLQYVASAVEVEGQGQEANVLSPTLNSSSTATQGAATADEEIMLIVPKKGDSGFFKVGRK